MYFIFRDKSFDVSTDRVLQLQNVVFNGKKFVKIKNMVSSKHKTFLLQLIFWELTMYIRPLVMSIVWFLCGQ